VTFIFFYQAIICILCVLSDAGASDTGHIKGYLCVCVCVWAIQTCRPILVAIQTNKQHWPPYPRH